MSLKDEALACMGAHALFRALFDAAPSFEAKCHWFEWCCAAHAAASERWEALLHAGPSN